MSSLTANEKSFVEIMGKSGEHARKGFELILKQQSFVKFFDTLNDKHFFDATKNPAPVPVPPQDHVQIPYWKALDYLIACARLAGDTDNAELAEKILAIARAVTAGSALGGSRDNHHTFRAFAEIIGLLPIASVKSSDLELVEVWLYTKYDRSGVVHALDEGALGRFLASTDSAAWRKAVQLVRYCTAIRWKPMNVDPDREEPVTVADEYFLEEIISHHASFLGMKVGAEAAKLFAERVREVFGRGGRAQWSYVFRAAVEEDGQNRQGYSAENCVVKGLRDVLLSWCDHDAKGAKRFVDSLLREENAMLRRIGIFVLGQRWEELRTLYSSIVDSELFTFAHLHELYGLLHAHFEAFSNREKEATVDAIRDLPMIEGDASGRRERDQLRWLSAVARTTYEPAAKWLDELTAEFGPQPEHPDYPSFTETRWGPGPSPYSAKELIALANEGSVVETLSAFSPSGAWRGPTVEALVEELERAVAAAPVQFVDVLRQFLQAPRRYQHALVNGFLKLWREPKASATPSDWNRIWNSMFDFLEQLLKDPQFWNTADTNGSEGALSSLSKVIADLLHDGTRDDQHAYPESLLPRGWSLIQILVEHGEAVNAPSDDPMTQAINSSKGRALEAAFSHILRRCRIADQTTGSHATTWAEMREFMNQELAQCVDANFEFSTLCGAYLGNLEYIDEDWLKTNIKEIFPVGHPSNFGCALGGLAYASATRKIYRMLRDAEVMDNAMRLELDGRHSRKKLMEKLTLGYLWGEETLDSPRFAYLFESDHPEYFELINLSLQSIRSVTLKPEQVDRVVGYWRCCTIWAQKQVTPPAKLLSSLSALTVFLPTAAKNVDLLLAVAPYVHVHHDTYEFLNELNRLVEDSPGEVCRVLTRFIDTHEPFYDYEDRMQTLVKHLADLEFRKDAIDFCNKLHSMPGMETLYNELMT